jgi:hypothetical protein
MQLFDSRLAQQRDLVHLFEVVVFRREPEDGDVFYARLRCRLSGSRNRRGSFKQREQRPSQQGDLLPGNNGASAGAQLCDAGERGRPRAEREALALQRIGQCSGVSARSGWLHPLAAEWFSSVPRTHRRVRALAHGEEVAEETGGMRQRCDGDTLGAHQFLKPVGQVPGPASMLA